MQQNNNYTTPMVTCADVCALSPCRIIISLLFILLYVSAVFIIIIYICYTTHTIISLLYYIFITSTTCRLLRFRSEDGLETLVPRDRRPVAHLHRGQRRRQWAAAHLSTTKANGASSPVEKIKVKRARRFDVQDGWQRIFDAC